MTAHPRPHVNTTTVDGLFEDPESRCLLHMLNFSSSSFRERRLVYKVWLVHSCTSIYTTKYRRLLPYSLPNTWNLEPGMVYMVYNPFETHNMGLKQSKCAVLPIGFCEDA